MTAKFEAYNEAGNLVATSDVPNLFVKATGIVDMGDANYVANEYAPYYTKALMNIIDDVHDTIIIAPTTGFAGWSGNYLFDGNYYSVFYVDDPDTDIPYAVLDSSPADTGTFGLKLYNEAGNPTFNSNLPFMLCNDVHVFGSSWSEGDSEAVTGVEDMYVLMGNVVYEFAIGTTGFPNTYQTFKPMVKLTTNLLSVSGSGWANRTAGGGAAGQQALTLLTVKF